MAVVTTSNSFVPIEEYFQGITITQRNNFARETEIQIRHSIAIVKLAIAADVQKHFFIEGTTEVRIM